ncbi:MAG: cytochrome c [Oligoflexia bacterium]|nr:cytochrome c [Oligoflexia bacterium]
MGSVRKEKMNFRKIIYLSFIFVFLVGCTCSGGRNHTDIEPFHEMLQQENIKAQEGDAEGTFMRLPPENTRARNKKYYRYKDDPEGAGENLKNPFEAQFSAELIGIGKRQYEKACIYCHGTKGGSEGKVVEKMTVKPPSLLTEKVFNYSDGRLYHIIHEGQGLMGNYRKQVRGEKERWALVNYVRILQKQALREKER